MLWFEPLLKLTKCPLLRNEKLFISVKLIPRSEMEISKNYIMYCYVALQNLAINMK